MTCFLLTYTAQAAPQPRIALIIGNAAYQGAALRTPVNDAMDMATTLQQLEFEITRVWLFFDDVHLKISKCGARLGRCVWSA
jgi:hypothetical protein